MRVLLVWKRRCADVRAGTPIGIPSRYDNIKRMAEMAKYHSEGLRGLFLKFDAHSEGLRGLFSKFDDHSEGLQGIFQLSETMPIQKR